jgi:hypothetical protein
MNADAHQLLLDLYAEWRRLSELEGAAIGRDKWPCVAQQQQLKRRLQTRIVEATDAWNRQRPALPGASELFETEFRPIVADLIRLESRNHELLCERRQHAHSAVASLGRSAAHLRGITRAYASGDGVRWQSYS